MSLSKPLCEFFAEQPDDDVSSVRHGELSFFYDIQKKRREMVELSATIKERGQELKSLHQQMDDLHDNCENVQEIHAGYDLFLKFEDAEQTAERAERECRETVEQREELERLKKEKIELIERHRQLKLEVQGHTEFKDMMCQLLKFTNFKDMDALTEYMESLIHFKDELVEKEQEAQEQVDLMKKERAAMRNQHHLLQMQRNNELALLRTELEDTRAEALQLEKQWTHVQETAAKQTLQLGQMKISTFNLSQMVRHELSAEEEEVLMDDTETQLDVIMTFVEDFSDAVKRYQVTTGTLHTKFKLHHDNKRRTTRSKKQ